MASLIEPQELNTLRRFLADARGMDLAQYSDSFLERRVLARMGHFQLGSIKDYMGMLATKPEELQKLIDSLTINVTQFFRDEELSEAVLFPALDTLRARPGGTLRPLIIWSAGCATGQEPYTVAMVLDRYAAKRGCQVKYQLFATDFNEDQLKAARLGEYPKAAANGVPAAYRSLFLTESGEKIKVAPALKRYIQFDRHDLATPPPIPSADLILCRNVMIYFTVPAKNQILTWFHRCLTPGGFMILGSAEIVLLHGLFKAVDKEHKVYQKLEKSDREAS